MLCLQGLPHIASQKGWKLNCFLLATVSTLSFASAGASAATQTIRGSFQGPAASQAYASPVIATGALTIGSGAQISAQSITAGAPPAGAALIMVSGSGSSLSAEQALVIGAAPDAYTGTTLNISSNAHVSAASVTAGLGDGTLGTINLTSYGASDRSSLVTQDLTLGSGGGNAALNATGQSGGIALVHVDGKLTIGQPDAVNGLGANTVWLGSGSALEVGGTDGIQATGTSKDYTFTLSGGTLRDVTSDLTSAVNISLGSSTTSTVDTGSFNTRLTGAITGGGNLVKTGSGILTLTGDNQYAHGAGPVVNTIVQQGTLAASPLSLRGAGVIQNDATLRISQDNYTGQKTVWPEMVSNIITGTGDLIKDGSKTVALTATNTYTGATVVSAGTLELGYYGGISGSINSSSGIQLLNASSNLTVYRDDTVTVSPNISGAGSVTKMGANTLTLSGVNTYAGGTDIQAGTLHGTTSSFGTGAISTVQGTTLAVDQAGDGTLNNAVSGAGAFAKLGAGTVTLASGNSYTGGTSIQGGTLTGDVSSFGTGAISTAQGTTLAVKQAGDGTLNNAVSGAGAFVKLGAGALVYSGDASALTGTTDVGQGNLSVLGNLGSSAVTVASGASVTGTGVIGSADVFGTFAPGQTASTRFGTLHVNGNVTMETGSTFAANVGASQNASQASLSGVLTIRPDATLVVTALPGADLRTGQSYTLIQASGGVNGTFAHYDQSGLVQTHSLIQIAEPTYSASNAVQITLQRNTALSFGYGASTRNQMMAGYGLDGIADVNQAGALTSLVAGLEDQQRYRALDALSGEIHASARTAMVNDSFYIRNAALNRLDCVDDDLRQQISGAKGAHTNICDAAPVRGLSTWGSVYGAMGHNASSAGTVGLNDNSVGWIMGADTMVGEWRVGGLLAYGRSMFSNGGDRSSGGHSNNVTLGAYGGTAWRVGGLTQDARVTLKLGADYTWNVLNVRRDIRIPGYAAHVSSNALGGTGQLYGETGYRFAIQAAGTPVEFEPFVRMAYVNYNSENVREHGGVAALRIKGMDQSIGYSAFGMKMATRLDVAGVTVAPHVSAAYRRAFGMTDMTTRESFRLARQAQGYGMDVAGVPLSINTAVVQTGLTARLADRLNVSVDYVGQYGGRMTTSGGSGKITYNW